jgi:hypothetical protein
MNDGVSGCRQNTPPARAGNDWQGLDEISDGMKAGFSPPIPASSGFRRDLL